MKNRETTSKSVASIAAKILSDPSSSSRERSAAASALTQYKSYIEETSAKAASAAAKVLSNPHASRAAKSAAASTLTQRANQK